MTETTIVTGGSNGIGATIVAARTAAGEHVLNLDRDQPAAGAPGECLRVDLADGAALKARLAEITGDLSVTLSLIHI